MHRSCTLIAVITLVAADVLAQPVLTLIEGPEIGTELPVYVDEEGNLYAAAIRVRFLEEVVSVPAGTQEVKRSDFSSAYTDLGQALDDLEANYGPFTVEKIYPYALWGETQSTSVRTGQAVTLTDLSQVFWLHFEEPVPVDESVAVLMDVTVTDYAEPPGIGRLLVEPDDWAYTTIDTGNTGLPFQWDLHQIEAAGAWEFATGSVGGTPIRIDVPDIFGIPSADLFGDAAIHPDLRYDAQGQLRLDNSRIESRNYGGHGSRVAGFAGSITNNTDWNASVAWDVRMRGFPSHSSVAIAQAACVSQPTGCVPADIINMSWYMSAGPSAALEDAVCAALARDVVLVSGAGNTIGYPTANVPDGPAPIFPAAYNFPSTRCPDLSAQVIAVSATTRTNLHPYGPNDLPWNYSPSNDPLGNPTYAFTDLAAPGEYVFALASGVAGGVPDHTAGYTNGTSFSSPIVASLVALMLTVNPSLVPQQIYEALTRTTDHVGQYPYAMQGNGLLWNQYLGYGRIDARRAIRHVIENFGATLGGTGQTIELDSTLHTASGTTLTIRPGTTVKAASGVQLVISGDLIATDVTFTERDAGQWWGGIVVADGSLTLTGGQVKHATTGITVYSPAQATIVGTSITNNTYGLRVFTNSGVTVSGAEFLGNWRGIQTDFIDNYGPPTPCFTNCRSSFTLENSRVGGSTDLGVYALNTDAVVLTNCIESSSGNGFTASNAMVRPFLQNTIRGNATTQGHGISVLSSASLYLNNPLQNRGLNRITANTNSELRVFSGGFAYAGVGDTDGWNAIYDANGGILIGYPTNVSPMEARKAWWGTNAGPPPNSPGTLYPNATVVNASNHLSNGNPTTNRCDVSLTGGGEVEHLTGDLGSSDVASDPETMGMRGEDLEALRAEIMGLRVALAASPAAPAAAGILRALHAAQRRDPVDVLGERTATVALMATLRTWLSEPALPATLRRVAEAALEAEVTDALTNEDYEDASTLLGTYAAGVEDDAVSRQLALVGAFVSAREGRYAEAASQVEVVAALTPDEDEARELTTLADIFFERADSMPPDGVTGAFAAGAHTAASALELALAVAPNPAGGSAVVTLTLPSVARVDVEVYDILGRLVTRLMTGALDSGANAVRFDSSSLPAGVYVIHARVEPEVGRPRSLTRRLTLLR